MTRQRLVWSLSIFAAACGLVAAAVMNWPFSQKRIVRLLESRSGREVKIASFRNIYFPPGFVAGDIRFLRHDHPERPALITVNRLVVASTWANLLTLRRRLPQVDVYDSRIKIPPRGQAADGKQHTLIRVTVPSEGELEIEKLVFHTVQVEFLPGLGHKESFRFPIRELTLRRIGNNQPFGFEGIVENPIPRGDIHEKGTFGPWNMEEPSRTPIEGDFWLREAHLADVSGIAGTLASEGKFRGTLDRIEIEGSASVPNFRVLRSPNTQGLTNKFQAFVDATNGDVELKQVQTSFGHTTIQASGRVSDIADIKGKVALLQAKVAGGRVEDLEKMFTKAVTPPLVGVISLATSVRLSPGDRPFLARLDMTGNFETSSGRFANVKAQDMIDRLTKSAAGASKKEQDADRETVRSRLAGRVTLKGGVARLDGLLLTAPATAVRMDGTFNVISKNLDLKGTMKTDGKLSDTQSGFKAFAVKMITPFLKRQHSTVVPFKISGHVDDLQTRLDLGGKRKL